MKKFHHQRWNEVRAFRFSQPGVRSIGCDCSISSVRECEDPDSKRVLERSSNLERGEPKLEVPEPALAPEFLRAILEATERTC
jgi:hypothetical protein